MSQILYLSLSRFYTNTLEKTESTLAQRPLVVHREKQVLDSNKLARRALVFPGMRLSEAKAILRDGAFIPWQADPYRAAQTAWLDRCCDISDVIQPEEQHSAWIDLSLHAQPDQLTLRLVSALQREFDFEACYGIAPSPWISQIVAREGLQMSGIRAADSISMHSTITDPSSAIAGLSTHRLIPIQPAFRERLLFLGYRTIGEVATVPLSLLRSQFGNDSVFIQLCARGGHSVPLEARYPEAMLSEGMRFDGLLEDSEELDRSLQRLAKNLSERLLEEDRTGKHLVATLEYEDFSVEVRRRTFAKPIQNFASLLSSLRLVLRETPREPLAGLRVRLENLIQAKRIQKELTSATSSLERGEAARQALNHVRTVFGDASLKTGSEIPLTRQQRVMSAWKDATGWR